MKAASDQVALQVQEQEVQTVIQRIVVLPPYVYQTEYVYVMPEATSPATATAAAPAGPAHTSGAAAITNPRATSTMDPSPGAGSRLSQLTAEASPDANKPVAATA